MSSKPSLPKGTRDFGPEVMQKRSYVLNAIISVFRKYGFLPLETPAMENLAVLTGKYGEEGDRLLYKILNSGDYLSKASKEDFASSVTLSSKIAEKGLRYDLTVPFARFVAMNRHELAFPFKRYQVQPVWRADRPQKGRYREFYQCDADVVGTRSLLCEAEIVLMIEEVFAKLGINQYEIRFNHRLILEGLCQSMGVPDKLIDLSTAIDKIDKIGWEGVSKELTNRGFGDSQIKSISAVLELKGSNSDILESLTQLLDSTVVVEGQKDISEFVSFLEKLGYNSDYLKLDLSLARGLSYYTGIIFEVRILNSGIGSVSGGGRYDNLTGHFGGEDIPGVGFSFGVDRLYDAMEELNLFPSHTDVSSELLIAHFDEESRNHGLKALNELRKADIRAEIYPDVSKLKKQLTYADRKKIPFVVLIGSEEMNSGLLKLKNMSTGEEKNLEIQEIIKQLQ